MCAKFNWQEEKEDGKPWSYDGSSSMREKPGSAPRKNLKRYLGPGLVLLALLVALSASAIFRAVTRVKTQGTVEPLNYQYASAPIDGTIVSIPVREGQTVKQGDVLINVLPDDPSIFQDVPKTNRDLASLSKELQRTRERLTILGLQQAQLQKDREMLAADRSETDAAGEKIRAADAEYQQRIRDEERARKLYEQEAISQVEYENAATQKELARTNGAIARANLANLENQRRVKLNQLQKDISVAAREIDVEKINLAQKETEIGETNQLLTTAVERSNQLAIPALADSQVIRREKNVGEHAAKGEILFLLSIGPERRIVMKVDPKYAIRLKVGQRALVYSKVVPWWRSRAGEGEVIEVGTYTRTQTGQTSASFVPVKVAVDKPTRLLPFGTTADVVIFTNE